MFGYNFFSDLFCLVHIDDLLISIEQSKRDYSQEAGDGRERESRERRTPHSSEKSDRRSDRDRYKEKERRRSISRSRSRSRSPRK